MQGFAQGTTYNIIYINGEMSITQAQVDSLLRVFDNSCSLYSPNSLISKINRGESIEADTYISECVAIARTISAESGGMYDITVKPLVEAYGFLKSDTNANVGALGRETIDSLLQYVGYQKVVITNNVVSMPKGVQIDLNSIAQGYSVDLLARFFKDNNITNFLVEVGGEIYASGVTEKSTPWRVGVDKPYDGNFSPGESLQTVVELKDMGLATSGNYRKYYTDVNGNRVNHTINPKSGESVTSSLLSATIIASSAALADGYATLMMTLGVEKSIEFLKAHPVLKAYLVYSNGTEYKVYEQ